MNVFEAQLLALAESMAEQLIAMIIEKVEAKLGLNVVVPPQAFGVQTPQSVE